ncbi:hypothetical protein PMNALOAF_1817 [Methylobacterium adhaesivum]|uniref:Uncharacterized protein n=1 Tax=Methylobacterium adhaesivum TaxID=333297 RepID=A0ABT8BCM0_9HYPH|nr:hypothetical protein [Methylobacterium adhaesivum]MDN3589555.1 hypothetical protein [Methylobacterium adhaesivum]GJD30570.1 hypothetical protein PMNALOAF_1817 [Methylobacterium adhaesivum]
MVVVTPVLPHPAASIADTPTSELIFIATECSRPVTGESFETWFREGGRIRLHGLSKTGPRRAAEASEAQLNTLFG